ncbi:MAG: molybdate ABC transporter permease subunit, partial [Bradymonadaceae bacterium]
GGETRTIPLAVYTLLQSSGGLDAIWRLVGVSLTLAFVAVLGFEWFQRRQKGMG